MGNAVKLGYDPSVGPSTRAKTDLADETQYNRPDPTQQRFVGQDATVIPRAHGNQSSGRARFTTELIVDPSNPATGEGGKRINLNHLDKEVMERALPKAGSAEDAWDIVRSLQDKPQAAKPQPAARSAPAQTVPSATDMLAQLGALQIPQAPQIATPAPAPQPVPEPVASPSGGSAELADLKGTVQTLVRLMAGVLQTQQSQQQQPVPQEKYEDTKAQDTVTGLGHLELGFLSESRDGNKPTVPVVLQMGPGGQASVKFHKVVVYGGLVVLIYDTRWDGGIQFFPPAVDYPITVKLPADNKSYRVYSRDCVFPIGKLEVCVLVVVTSEEVLEAADETAPAATGVPQLAPKRPRGPLPVPEIDDEGPDEETEELPAIL